MLVLPGSRYSGLSWTCRYDEFGVDDRSEGRLFLLCGVCRYRYTRHIVERGRQPEAGETLNQVVPGDIRCRTALIMLGLRHTVGRGGWSRNCDYHLPWLPPVRKGVERETWVSLSPHGRSKKKWYSGTLVTDLKTQRGVAHVFRSSSNSDSDKEKLWQPITSRPNRYASANW
jgi:hypothetical protein